MSQTAAGRAVFKAVVVVGTAAEIVYKAYVAGFTMAAGVAATAGAAAERTGI